MPDNRLEIVIMLQTAAAEKADQRLHAAMRDRIRQTSDAQQKSDQAYIKAVKTKANAIEAFAKEYARRLNEQDKAQAKSDQDYIKAVKLKLRAIQALSDGAKKATADEASYQRKVTAERVSIAKKAAAEVAASEKQRIQEVSQAQAEANRNYKSLGNARVKIAKAAAAAESSALESSSEANRKNAKGMMASAQMAARERSTISKKQYDDSSMLMEMESLASNRIAREKRKGQAFEDKMATRDRKANFAQQLGDFAEKSKQEDDADKQSARQRLQLQKDFLFQSRQSRQADTDAQKAARSKFEIDQEASVKRLGKGYVKFLASKYGADHEYTKKASGLLKEQEGSVTGIAKAYTRMRVAAEIGQMVTATFQTMGASAAEAREYVKGIVAEMERARTITKELANLEGKKPTAVYTAQVAREAAEAGATPEAYASGKKSFRDYAGDIIGKEGASDDERAAERKNGKMSGEEAAKLQTKGAKTLSILGIDQETGQKLMGTVAKKMAIENPDVTADEVNLEFRKMMAAARTATGPTGVAAGQLTETIQEFVGKDGDLKSGKEAARMMRNSSQANPTEGATLTRGFLRGLAEIKADESKMEELGITPEMSAEEATAQIDKKTKEIADEEGNGMTQSRVVRRYFKDSRELRGAMAGIRHGIHEGGNARFEEEWNAISPELQRKEESEGENTQEFQAERQRSRQLMIDRERAAKQVSAEKAKREATAAVTGSGDLEKREGLIDAAMTMGGQTFNQGDRKDQEVRAERARRVEMSLKGSAEGREHLNKVGDQALGIDGRYHPTGYLGRRYADEGRLAEAEAKADEIREKNKKFLPSTPVPENDAEGNVGSAKSLSKDQRKARDAAVDAADAQGNFNQAMADQAKHLEKTTKNLEKQTRPGVPVALPAKPNVQRN